MSRRAIDRSIASLAIPALGALVAEPLFLIVDSAMIGHLGAEPLAGLAIASTILQTAVAVSYTHLDVYKRQISKPPKKRLRAH